MFGSWTGFLQTRRSGANINQWYYRCRWTRNYALESVCIITIGITAEIWWFPRVKRPSTREVMNFFPNPVRVRRSPPDFGREWTAESPQIERPTAGLGVVPEKKSQLLFWIAYLDAIFGNLSRKD